MGMDILSVGLGGMLGSVLRYLVSQIPVASGSFPLRTFFINVTGSLLIGLLFALNERGGWLSENSRLFWMTGLCGGYTTFSAFSLENFQLIKAGAYGTAAFYMIASLCAGVAGVIIGIRAAALLPR